MKRLFVGIPIAPECRENITPISDELMRTGASLSLVSKENLHFTLTFLGEQHQSKSIEIETILANIVKHHTSFSTTLQTLSAFPSAQHPKVVWIGNNAPQLRELMQDVMKSLAQIRLSEYEDTIPHITLARIKQPTAELIAFLKQHHNTTFGTMTINKIVLFESVITPKGPIYTVVKEFFLQ